jgi:tetratricopeptide (TPR) repeat protein
MSSNSSASDGGGIPSVYDAFISYSHARDKPVASALQTVLQKLGKPWYRRRALRIFRDDTSLAATPELWPAIEQALGQSRYLIVLASPQLAASHWCGLEVAYWLEHKSLDTLLIALTEGDLAWDRTQNDFIWNDTTPLPPILKGRLRGEPKWIDLRTHREVPDARDAHLIDSSADFAAAIHGMPKEDLLSQEVRQQKRALRLAWAAAAALMLLTAGAGWQWWEAETARRAALASEKIATEQRAIAEQQRADAQAQRDRAERNLALARRAADDLVFNIAQGVRNVEGMRAESVRQILEAAQSVIDELARSAPDDPELERSRAAMLTEFVFTYLAVGDIERARRAAEEALALMRKIVAADPGRAPKQGYLSVSLEKLGDVHLAAGDPAKALALYEESVAIRRKVAAAEPGSTDWQRDLSVILIKLGDRRLANGDQAGALAAYEESLGGARKLTASNPNNNEWQRVVSASLSRIGNARLAAGDRVAALAVYEEALAITRKAAAAEPVNVDLQRDLYVHLVNVGDVRLAGNDRSGALGAYEDSLEIIRRLARTDPGQPEWQADVAVCLYKVSLVSDPLRTAVALREALAILEKLNLEGKLNSGQLGWLRTLREAVAKLPAEGASAQ